MTVEPDITIRTDDQRWNGVEDLEDRIDSAVRAVLSTALPPERQNVEIGVILTDDSTVQGLNLAHRGQDRPTNILSFAHGDGEPFPTYTDMPVPLGDLVLAYQTLTREADLDCKPLGHHLSHLIVHGVLHLLGHDHENDADGDRMEALEVSMLSQLSIPNPYQEDTPPAQSGGMP